MRTVKVLLLVDGKRLGGMEHLNLDICRYIDRERFEVFAAHYSAAGIREAFRAEGVNCVCLGRPASVRRLRDLWANLGALRCLLRHIRQKQIDVIVASGITSHALASLAVILTGVRQIRIPGALMKSVEPL